MEEHEEMAYKETIGIIQAIRIINLTLRDPDELDRRLEEIQTTIEKGATAHPTKD